MLSPTGGGRRRQASQAESDRCQAKQEKGQGPCLARLQLTGHSPVSAVSCDSSWAPPPWALEGANRCWRLVTLPAARRPQAGAAIAPRACRKAIACAGGNHTAANSSMDHLRVGDRTAAEILLGLNASRRAILHGEEGGEGEGGGNEGIQLCQRLQLGYIVGQIISSARMAGQM